MSLSGLRAQAVDLAELKDYPTLRSLTLQECSWANDDDLQHLRHLGDVEKVDQMGRATLPQPSAFAALVNRFDGQCPCCRREFADT